MADSRRREKEWERERWTAEAVQAIEAWGSALFAFDDCLYRKWKEDFEPSVRRLEKLNKQRLPLALAPGRTPETGHSEREQFVRDAFCCAGLRAENRLEHLILYLADRFSEVALAERMIRVEDALFPDGAGLTAAHLRGITSERFQGIAALAEIANDERRQWQTRVRALLCLHDLNAFGVGEDHSFVFRGSGEYVLDSVRVTRRLHVTDEEAFEPVAAPARRKRRRAAGKEGLESTATVAATAQVHVRSAGGTSA